MCLISTPERERRRVVRREDPYYNDAPLPVSNYHGGPPARTSTTYVRRASASVPRERTSYRSSYRSIPAPVERRSGDYYSRTSRTYVR